MSNITNASSQTNPSYLSLSDDVIPWLQAQSAAQIGSVQQQNLQLITDMACEWCADFIQRPIAPTTYDRRFDGWANWNGAYIMLPFYPVLEIISVVEYWGAAGPHNLSESTPTNQIDGWQCVYPTGRINRVFPGNVQKPWFPGSRNIEVVWTAGYNPVPPTIKMATLELIAHWYRNTQQQSGRIGGQISPASEYEPAEGASGGMWSGVPYRVTSLLEPYLSYGIG